MILVVGVIGEGVGIEGEDDWRMSWCCVLGSGVPGLRSGGGSVKWWWSPGMGIITRLK